MRVTGYRPDGTLSGPFNLNWAWSGAAVYEQVYGFPNSGGSSIVPGGRAPEASLVQVRDGTFYGTTFAGGSGGYGTVFKLTRDGELMTLVDFTGNGVSLQ